MKQAQRLSYICSENLIDRYIANGIDQARNDGTFAQSIEDEDIFNIRHDINITESKSPELDFMIDSSEHGRSEQEREYPNTLNLETSEDKDHLYQDDFDDDDAELNEIVKLPQFGNATNYGRLDVDDIFLDDYSSSPSPKIIAENTLHDNTTSQDNTNPKQPKPPSPAELKRLKFLETVRQQAQEKCRVVKKISLDQEGLIEIGCKSDQLVSDSNSKFIFNKLFSKSAERTKDDIEQGKSSWVSYKAMLRKRISGQKRKTWDLFQKPVDGFNDEEELIEEPNEEEDESEEVGDEQKVDEEFEDEEMEMACEIEKEEQPTQTTRRHRRISDDEEDVSDLEDDELPNGNFEDLEREDELVLGETEESRGAKSRQKDSDYDDLEDDNLSDLESDLGDSYESD